MHTAFRIFLIGTLVFASPLVLCFLGAFFCSLVDSTRRFIKKPNMDDFCCIWMLVGFAIAMAAGVCAWLDKEA